MDFKNQALDLQKKPFLSFGWVPDYEIIGIYYQRAANVFANSDIIESVNCYNLATDNLLKAGIIFEAAKCQEMLAKLMKRTGKLAESSTAFDKAGELFRKLAQNDTASDMFSNAAQIAEQQKDVKLAGTLFTKAVDVLVDNDKGLLSHDMFKKSSGFFLRNQLYRECIELYKKQILVIENYKKPGISKIQLSIVIIYVATNDALNATQYLNQCISNLGGSSASMALLGGAGNIELPSELVAAQTIIDSYQKGDLKALTATVNDFIMFLDVEVAKLSTSISVATKTAIPINAAPAIDLNEINEEEGFA